MTVHYAETFYGGRTLREAAKVYLEHLPNGTQGLLTTGSSGCAIASAMLTMSKDDLQHLCVRKENEWGHQSGYAGICLTHWEYVIVDDFVATGASVTRLLQWARSRGMQVKTIIVDRDMRHPDEKAQQAELLKGCHIILLSKRGR